VALPLQGPLQDSQQCKKF